MSPRKPSYTPAPSVPPQLMPRLAAVVEVLAGLKTVSAAARTLGLSRNHFQTILHRGLLAMVQAITVKSGGRPGQSSELATLQRQLRDLQRENARLKRRVDSTQRLLEVAGSLLHGRIRPAPRPRQPRMRAGASRDRSDDSDPDTARRQVLEGVDEMRRLGLTTSLAAAIAGVDASTLRRWRAHARQSLPLARCPQPAARCIPAAAASRADELVRQLHGLIGAESLRHCVAGLTRRSAACIKAQTLTTMERERKAALVRVRISQAGILRGFDAMHFATTDGSVFALIGADGAIPYRTSLTTGTHYDAALVVRALRVDFEHHGAPLVLRLDRASAHDTSAVRELLEAYAVLVLHGPPHYPCFYGQLERQNREHRAWIGVLATSRTVLEACLADMLEAVNNLWRRRTLQWHTATELWNVRPRLDIDRTAFREEVHERALRIAHALRSRGQSADLAERLAIQRTLERMGYLQQEIGGWC